MTAPDVHPALVNLAVTGCRPTVAGYEATILDLAARGYLAVTDDPGGPDGCWVTPRELTSHPDRLAGFERQVLGDVRARLAETGTAPLAALTQACIADPDGTWEPFLRALTEQGARLGIRRRRRPCRRLTPEGAAVAARWRDPAPAADGPRQRRMPWRPGTRRPLRCGRAGRDGRAPIAGHESPGPASPEAGGR